MNLSIRQNGPAYLAVAIAIFGLINTLVDIPQDTQQAISVLIVAVAGALGITVQRNLTDPKPTPSERGESTVNVVIVCVVLLVVVIVLFGRGGLG